MENKKIRTGITQGDSNGINTELIIKAFADIRMLDICTPVIYASQKVLLYYRKYIKSVQFFNFCAINTASENALSK